MSRAGLGSRDFCFRGRGLQLSHLARTLSTPNRSIAQQVNYRGISVHHEPLATTPEYNSVSLHTFLASLGRQIALLRECSTQLERSAGYLSCEGDDVSA